MNDDELDSFIASTSAAPVAPAAPVRPAPLPISERRIEYGKTAAQEHGRFLGGYRVVMGDRGVSIEGVSPDGRHTGTCDRCGTSIQNVYVFGDRDRQSIMHVGIDCAQMMGYPLASIKSARTFWRDQERAAYRAARAASAAERHRLEEEAKNARLSLHASVVEELRGLLANPNATKYERDQLDRMINSIARNGTDWMEPAEDEQEWCTVSREILASVRDRLGLCATSKLVQGDKKGAITATLRAYRKPIPLEPYTYNAPWTFVNFLTDDKGNAFVYKGSKKVCNGEEIVATFSIEGSDTRDGLTATILKRPRKGFMVTRDEHGNAVTGGAW